MLITLFIITLLPHSNTLITVALCPALTMCITPLELMLFSLSTKLVDIQFLPVIVVPNFCCWLYAGTVMHTMTKYPKPLNQKIEPYLQNPYSIKINLKPRDKTKMGLSSILNPILCMDHGKF